MNIRNLLGIFSLAFALTFALTACGDKKEGEKKEDTTDTVVEAPAPTTIVDVASADTNLSTLVGLLVEAGWADSLKAEGPFTVFAPTNAAFAKIPAKDLDALKADKAKLANVLKYHVVSGKVMAADVKDGDVATLQGSNIKLSTKGGVKINGKATVTQTDIAADNGVIHVIDAVLMPAK